MVHSGEVGAIRSSRIGGDCKLALLECAIALQNVICNESCVAHFKITIGNEVASDRITGQLDVDLRTGRAAV